MVVMHPARVLCTLSLKMQVRPASVPFHFIDSPSTTSATTYNIQGVIERVGYQYTMLRNIGGYNYNNDEMASGTCQLTLQEISA